MHFGEVSAEIPPSPLYRQFSRYVGQLNVLYMISGPIISDRCTKDGPARTPYACHPLRSRATSAEGSFFTPGLAVWLRRKGPDLGFWR